MRGSTLGSGVFCKEPSESEYTTDDSKANMEGGYSEESEEENTPDSPVRPPPTKPRREKKFVVHSRSDDEGNTKCAP